MLPLHEAIAIHYGGPMAAATGYMEGTLRVS
jgi:hypothetical protein